MVKDFVPLLEKRLELVGQRSDAVKNGFSAALRMVHLLLVFVQRVAVMLKFFSRILPSSNFL